MQSQLNYKVVPLGDVPREDLRHSDQDRQPLILVVHDEELVADCIATLLARSGFTARVAYNGKTALEMALDLRPELLLSDIGLRDIDGVQLAIAIVNAIPDCKILLFSGHDSYNDILTARQEGYDFPALLKPVHPADMLQRVREHLTTAPIQ
ncbi:MAG: response regulator [Acidobacteria bacterium]|nr:response regulator [Acidobacteriota bacterium]